jgi:alpha-glucosidase (family GH31 glycosyl hydrolase)
MFALGYHQCRWNYNDEPDVDMAYGKCEELDIPFDVLWPKPHFCNWWKPHFCNCRKPRFCNCQALALL